MGMCTGFVSFRIGTSNGWTVLNTVMNLVVSQEAENS
jgi:hypothetical protein